MDTSNWKKSTTHPTFCRAKGQPTAKSKGELYHVIAEQCRDCMGGTGTHNLNKEIANCTATSCALKPFRPYQHLKTKIGFDV